jgi:hypothetical protein
MLSGPSGYWYWDGIDLWNTFAIGIKEGTALFLQAPAKKDSIVHDWPDQNGIDVDLTKFFFKERDIVLQCWMITETEIEFWQKRNAFLSRISQTGLHRITITAHQSRSYYVYYLSCSAYRQIPSKTLRNIPDNMIVHEFSITLREPEPQLENFDTFIAADDGSFLVT